MKPTATFMYSRHFGAPVLPLCFIFFFMISVSSTASLFTNETDLQSLLAFKNLISEDPLATLSSWNNSIPLCKWQGVTCGRRHQRVTGLVLASRGLVGSLSPCIGNLTFLRWLDLGNNSFHGRIPSEMGRLSRLQFLRLLNNTFQGELIPSNSSHWPELEYINVANNNLGGKIPADLGFHLPKLYWLVLCYNHFSGTIPPSIGNLSSLLGVCLALNNLEGTIPSELGQLSQLIYFELGMNNLSGTIPPSIYNLSFIQWLTVNNNQLEGVLPPDLGLTLPRLQHLRVYQNQFHGAIPPSLANASGLVDIEIHVNSFTGLPTNLGILEGLLYLFASDNPLQSGTNGGSELLTLAITSLSNCSKLRHLVLIRNGFTGLLPRSIANLSTTITRLALGNNNISGSIPVDFGNLVSLQWLYLTGNMLTGTVPDSIGKLSQMEELRLGGNNISGEIPSSIGNLTRLLILDISINMLDGSVPISLGTCTNLQQIYLGHNRLTGAIPQQVFSLSSLIFLDLGSNSITGSLPIQVGSLTNLEMLNVSDNKLSGEIPITLGNCVVLEFLCLEANHFEGTIPTPFEQLKGLQVLDISRNNLSGQIPMFLGELPFMQDLNLSYNLFDGVVPTTGVFANASAFSVVGNNKLCGGIRVLQLPACSVNVTEGRKSSFNRRDKVIALGVTLPIVIILVCLLSVIYRIRGSGQQVSSILPLQNLNLPLSYRELHQATNGFSSTNLIGVGGYGSVFKADLASSCQTVAVKVLNLLERGANESFMAECEALRSIRHRNLVKLITSCSSIDSKGNDFKALVFDFMENGSLESWLHPINLPDQDPKDLNFVQRLNISIDVACALDYLHHQCDMCLIHCDLKPSNILLDKDFCAHVSDFGLAKIVSTTTGISSTHQMSRSVGITGTIGYVAPEYGMGEDVTTQGDMYSYGVLLLEMFTGKRPTDNIFTENLNLHNFVKLSLPNQVMEIVDPRIMVTGQKDVCLTYVLQLGISCSSDLPNQRLNARDVLVELQRIKLIACSN